MRPRTEHIISTALAALSALVIHQLAYLLAYPVAAVRADAMADHGHLSTQWALVTPAAVIAAAVFVLRQVRNLHLAQRPDWRPLAAIGGAMFLVQEVMETALGGNDPLVALTHPAALIGLALAPLVGFAVTRILSEASELVARFLRPPSPVPYPRLVVMTRPAEEAAPSLCELSGIPSRGPPRVRL